MLRTAQTLATFFSSNWRLKGSVEQTTEPTKDTKKTEPSDI